MSASPHRLFFALWPPDDVREAVSAATTPAVEASGGRAVAAENLHLTLAFLHNVEAELVPCIADAAERARTEAFSLTLSRVGYWYRSRILWLAPGRSNGVLEALVQLLWQELDECGFTPERRRFRPHVTLARDAAEPDGFERIDPIEWPVQRFSLMESITGSSRSTYEEVQSWPLAP